MVVVMDYISLHVDVYSVVIYLKMMVAWQVEKMNLSNNNNTKVQYDLENGWQYVRNLFLML